MPRYQPPNTARVYARKTIKDNKENPQAPCDWCDNERWGMIFHQVTNKTTNKVIAHVCDDCFLGIDGVQPDPERPCSCGLGPEKGRHLEDCTVWPPL